MIERGKFEVPIEFKKLILRHQEKRGISLRTLAAEAGISVSYLSRILSGERGLPRDEEIINLAKAIDIKPDLLLIAAGRVPKRKPQLKVLFRKASELTPSEMKEVREKIEELINRRKSRKR